MVLNSRLVCVLLCVLSSVTVCGQDRAKCGVPFTFAADRLQIPLTTVNDFVFVQADVNGTPGKLMIDTGTTESLVLNDHRLTKLGEGVDTGLSNASSGQTFRQTLRTCVRRVSIASAPPADVPDVESDNLDFIEKDITTDFLGFIGYQAFARYAFELDYVRRQLTLEKGFAGSPTQLVQNKKVLAALHFTTRRRPNDPVVDIAIGNTPFIGLFDTGQAGLLEMTDAKRLHLIQSGDLVPLNGTDSDGERLYRVTNLELAPGLRLSLPAMTVHEPGSLADRGIGVSEQTVIYLGSQVLNQFKTVWDWPNHTIYFLDK